MDFVVGESSAVQLAHTWSFQIESVSEVARDIKSWGYTLERLRDRGRTVGESPAVIEPEIPVEVVYAPPLTEAQRDVFEEAKRVFGDLGVTSVPRDAIDRVVGEARQQLRLKGLNLDLLQGRAGTQRSRPAPPRRGSPAAPPGPTPVTPPK